MQSTICVDVCSKIFILTHNIIGFVDRHSPIVPSICCVYSVLGVVFVHACFVGDFDVFVQIRGVFNSEVRVLGWSIWDKDW